MAAKTAQRQKFNIMIVGQSGRIGYEAALFAASLRRYSPEFKGRLIVAEPQPGPLWPSDPRIGAQSVYDLLAEMDAEVIGFDSQQFGHSYPYGNKIEGLSVLPEGEPFVFFDSDTLVTSELADVPFDFTKPSASMRREGTWPQIELYGPGYSQTWKSLYDKFGLDFASSLDLSQPDEFWQRYLYFNAGWFFGDCPRKFGDLFLKYACEIRDDPPEELICQVMQPWLDQVALPLVIHALGGSRHTIPQGFLDGAVTCHYRLFPLLYARESDAVIQALSEVATPNKIKKVLKEYEPIKKMVYQNKGAKVRALFDQNDLPRREQALRNRIKRENLWLR